MIKVILVSSFIACVAGKCCRNCNMISDQGCLYCNAGVLTLGLCTEFCPSGYTLFDFQCYQISKVIFSISFSDPVSLLSNQVNN